MGEKRKRGIITQDNILREAAALFARKGYEAVSVREIAARCSIKESSIYNHFTSKQAILTSLLTYFAQGVAKTRLTETELTGFCAFMSAEEILKQLIIHTGQQSDETMDYVAAIIFSERFRNQEAAELYFTRIVQEQAQYYGQVFTLLAAKGLLSISPAEAQGMGAVYNNSLVCLAQEYAMAKTGMAQVTGIIKKMMETAEFFAANGRRKDNEQ